MKITSTELLAKLPSSWEDITLETYLNKLLHIKIEESEIEAEDFIAGYENTIKAAAIFLDLTPEIVEQFPMSLINDITIKLGFLNQPVQPLEKSRYKWIKRIEDPSYDQFILYMKVTEQLKKSDFSNLPLIIKNICLDKLSDEEIMKLPMSEVNTGFFFLRKSLMKFLQSMQISLLMTIGKKETKRRLKKLISFKRT